MRKEIIFDLETYKNLFSFVGIDVETKAVGFLKLVIEKMIGRQCLLICANFIETNIV